MNSHKIRQFHISSPTFYHAVTQVIIALSFLWNHDSYTSEHWYQENGYKYKHEVYLATLSYFQIDFIKL